VTNRNDRTTIDLVADVKDSLDAVEALEPEVRAKTAHQLWPQVLNIQARVAALRRSGVRGLRAEGYSLSEVGAMLGMSTSRVKQIETGLERRPKEVT
jgi:DNA-directed RNA polymerase sigma subunit (sigma70/sigma32)